MIKLPRTATKMRLDNASIDFFEFTQEGLTYYYFDSSFNSAPEPMINAMIGLHLLENSTKRLIMINHSIPNGLFPKIQENFEYEIEELKDGNFQILFKHKRGSQPQTNFQDNHCSG